MEQGRVKGWTESWLARARRWRIGGAAAALLILGALLLPRGTRAADSAAELLGAALERARAASSYRVDIDLQQTTYPAASAQAASAQAASAQFTIAGQVRGGDARLAIRPGRLPAGAQAFSADGQEWLIAGGALYQRQGDLWARQNDATAMPGLNADGLSLLEQAREPAQLAPAETAAGRFERVAFILRTRDVIRALNGASDPALAEAGGLRFGGSGELWIDASGLPARLELRLDIQRAGRDAARTNALSIAEYRDFGAQFPDRWFDPAAGPLTGAPQSILPGTGLRIENLAPGAALALAALVAGAWCAWAIGRRRARPSGRAYRAVALSVAVALLSPHAAQAARLLEPSGAASSRVPPASQVARLLHDARDAAARQGAGPFAPSNAMLDADADEDGDGLPNGYELRLGSSPFNPDSDLDGLTDRQEVLGTVCEWIGFAPGSDVATQVYTSSVPSNPILADSNNDGLRDGEEFRDGGCWYRAGAGSQRTPGVWSDDNDADGVPDSLDLSPFSLSGELGGVGDYFDWTDPATVGKNRVYFSNPGANLNFESIDAAAGPASRPYPFYAEVQLRASAPELMRYAYKSALAWPKDFEGNIRNNGEGVEAALASLFLGEDLRSSGRIQIVPFLQVGIREGDLPSQAAMALYGITATKETACPANCVYQMVVPLAPVERNGQVFALQAKVLHDFPTGDTNLFRRWRDARLKWAVQGDIVRSADGETYRPSPSNSHGIIVYDTPYRVTGLQTQRQGGAEMFVAGAYAPSGRLFDDGPVALLRAGMEEQFLKGRLSLVQVGARFNWLNATPSASLTETWGITHAYGILYGPRLEYSHLDLAVLTTMQTTTRQLLNAVYPSRNVSPTLILASEQRTSTLNADDTGGLRPLGVNGVTDVTLNTCLKPMITSRSLKLQTYRWNPTADGALLAAATVADTSAAPRAAPGADAGAPGADIQSAAAAPLAPLAGDWEPLSLEEVLQKVESEFAQAFPDIQQAFDAIQAAYETLEDLYQQALNILKMATTVWHLGQTVIEKISSLDLSDLDVTLSDAAMLARLLEQNGVLPSLYATAVYVLLDVFEAGGPLAWIEEQFNRVVEFVEGVAARIGSFFDGAPSLSLPTEKEFLSFTHTAINVLNYLAMLTGFDFLADLAQVLTKVIEIYKLIKKLIDTVITVVKTIQQTIESAADTARALLDGLLAEARALAGSLSLVGLIVQIGLIWVSLAITLLNNNLPPLIVQTLVARAIAETIIAVAIFVIATVVPYGYLLLVAFAIIKALEAIFGVKFDPISIFLDWFFGIEISRLSTVLDQQVGQVAFVPQDPQGGAVEGERFRVSITSSVTLAGTSAAIDQSFAGVQTGYYATAWYDFPVCTQDPSQLQQWMTDYAEFVQGPPLYHGGLEWCLTLKLAQDGRVVSTNNGDAFEYVWQVIPFSLDARGPKQFTMALYTQRYDRIAYAEYTPRRPRVNTWTFVDVNFSTRTLNYACSPFLDLQGECYEFGAGYASPPAVTKLYFDILPATLFGLWAWPDLANTDPDGDGLEGYFDAAANRWTGPDALLCGNAANAWDADGDGASDKFEAETGGLNPCQADSDGDGLGDNAELLLGTAPNDADTDNDGLKDGQEAARWDPQQDRLAAPWTVDMAGAYPGLPEPAAYPSPLHANIDRDHRNDKKERDWRTSPNAFDPIPDLPVELMIEPDLVHGGGTRVLVHTSPWPNDGPATVGALLTVTLPVAFGSLAVAGEVRPAFPPIPQYGTPSLQSGSGPTTFVWSIPPLWFERRISITLSGLPAIPGQPVSVTAQLAFSRTGALRLAADTAPLPVNLGGPAVALAAPANGAALNGGPKLIQGLAGDPEGVSRVYVCAKTSPPCGAADWLPALGGPAWAYSWAPPTEGVFTVQAYGVDTYGVPGPATPPITVGVDMKPPAGGRFDLSGTAWLSSTFVSRTLATVRLTGRITDAAGAFSSGAGTAVLLIDDGRGPAKAELKAQPADQPGAPASPFAYAWEFPLSGFGGVAPDRARWYTVTLGVADRAGNAGGFSQTLTVMIDDKPPAVVARPPQTAPGAVITLTGRADDTALLSARSAPPYTRSMSLGNFDTVLAMTSTTAVARFVGDLNGDAFDDVAIAEPSTAGQSLRIGLFFGRPGGLPQVAALPTANVIFTGESLGAGAAPPLAGNLDVNGDGVGDLLIGDPRANGGSGKAYLVLGRRAAAGGSGGWSSPFSLAAADWQLSLPGARGFGASVAAAGDVDGDGLSDALVGAVLGSGRSGPAYLYLGRERGVPPLRAAILTPHACSVPASNLAGLGDADGDGLSDLLVAYAGLGTRACPSGVALVSGRAAVDGATAPTVVTLPLSATAVFTAPGTLQTVSAAGDVNGDGLADALVGDPQPAMARVFVVFGRRPESSWPAPPAGVGLVSGADASFRDMSAAGGPGARLGAGLAPMGDLDRDGWADFAFGNPGLGSGPNRAAIQRGILLSRTLEQPVMQATFLISGTSPAQRTGEFLSSGDVNGDGVRDVLIGAPGIQAAVLLHGEFSPGPVSGVARVEVGVSGPNVDPGAPLTATLPAAWRGASLGSPNGPFTAWTAVLTAAVAGDYRVYARAVDRAGNRSREAGWYLGNLSVNLAAVPFGGASVGLSAALISKTHLALTGGVTTAVAPQHLRVYDGYQWRRLPPAAGGWAISSTLPRADRRTLTFRAVTRDAFGGTRRAAGALTTDTLVIAPVLSASLPANTWLTDITPTLVVSWPAVADGSGIANRWASIDQVSQTVPAGATGANIVARALSSPGAWFGHVSVRDGAGNSLVSHAGPFLVNRSRTPSAIHVDGYLDIAGGEYPTGTLLNYDPYALSKPAALYGTWDARALYLAWPGAGWGAGQRLTVYLDTRAGGTAASLAPFGRTHALPMQADFAFVISGTQTQALYSASGGGWSPVAAPSSFAVVGSGVEMALDRAELGASGAVALLAYAEDSLGVWGVVPGAARPSAAAVLSGSVAFAGTAGRSPLRWEALGDGARPDAGLDQLIAPRVAILPGWNTALLSNTQAIMTVTVANPDIGPYVSIPITVSIGPTTPPQLAGFVGVPSGANCQSCPANGRAWVLRVNVAAGGTQTVTLPVKTAVLTATGLFTLPISVGAANARLSGQPQPAWGTQLGIDHSLARVGFGGGGQMQFVKPGLITQALSLSAALWRCWTDLEVDTGGGSFLNACTGGDCFTITGTLLSGSAVWRARVRNANGLYSPAATRTLVVDGAPPATQITPAPVFTGVTSLLLGLAQDGASQPPAKVLVSVGGKPFVPAIVKTGLLTPAASVLNIAGMEGASAAWLLPIAAGGRDGEAVTITARAVDRAGNLGPASAPVSVVIDTAGPRIAVTRVVTEAGGVIQGQVSDGSGVAAVEVSLDGGISYAPAALNGGAWTFTAGGRTGARAPITLVRARDVWGNASQAIAAGLLGVYRARLPIVGR